MTTLGEALALTMLVGAANWDATPEQREKLRTRLTPLLQRYKEDGNEAHIRAALRDVMGVQWKPTGDWATFLKEEQ
jgi:hypothetical protein